MNWAWLLVGAVYAVGVALGRRRGGDPAQSSDDAHKPLRWRVALIFYALVLAFLWRPLTQDVVNFPVDAIRLLPPWSAYGALDKFAVSNFEIHDLPMQTVPWAHQVRESWRTLDVPLWNEQAGLGYPLLANAQSAALSPMRLVALPLPLAHAISAEAALKLLVALTFTFLYCRRRGYGELASIAGAIAFAFSSFLVVWLHFAMATTVCWLPAVFYAIDLLAEQRTRKRVVLSAFLGAVMFFGGHPESVALVAMAAAAYALWVLVTERPRGFLVSLLLPSAIAALLSLPLALPFLEAATRSHRFAMIQGQPYLGMPYSDLRSLAPMLHPRYFGRGLGMPAEALGGFAGILAIAAWAGVLVHVVRKRAWHSRELFFVVATALAFAMINGSAPGEPPYPGIVGALMNPRLRLLFCFFGAVQIAALLHYTSRLSIAVGVAVAAAIGAFVVLKVEPADVNVLLPSVAVLLLAFVPRRVQVLLVAAITFELWFAMRDWNPVLPAAEAYPRTLLTDALRNLIREQREPWRIVGLGPTLFPNAHVFTGAEDLRQHDPMASADAIAYLRANSSYETKEYFAKWNDADAPVLDRLNVRWILTEPARDLPHHRLLYDGPDGRIYENAGALPRFFAAGATVQIAAKHGTRYRLHITAPQPAQILSSEPYYPGWRAEGFTVKKMDGAFVGFDVPAGTHDVVVDYAPLSFRVGAGVALLTLAAVLVWWGRGR
ncbi:MAG TPA: hypothetical protein VF618_13825 [Thermoanaerobaculia bacterium]